MRAFELIREEDRTYGDTPPRTKPLDIDQAIELAKQHCQAALREERFGVRMFRGIRLDAPAGFFDPSNAARPRVSRNTENFITLLMDNSPRWANYPKRSRSMICSTSLWKTGSYGRSFLVLPYDGTKIAIAPTHDIWYGFKESTGFEIPDINDSLNEACYSLTGEQLDQHNYTKMCDQLNRVGKIICELTANSDHPNGFRTDDIQAITRGFTVDWNHPNYHWTVIKHLTNSGRNPNLAQTLEEELDPGINNFKLVESGSLGIKALMGGLGSGLQGHEVWLEGPAVLIHEDHWDTALKFNEIRI